MSTKMNEEDDYFGDTHLEAIMHWLWHWAEVDEEYEQQLIEDRQHPYGEIN